MTHSNLGDDATIRLDGFQCPKANTADELQISRGNPVATNTALDGVGLPEAPAVRSGVPAAGVTHHKAAGKKRGKRVSEAEFRRLWADLTISVTEIGRRLGISCNAAKQRAAKRGLPQRTNGRPWRRTYDHGKMIRLYSAGLSMLKIAQVFGCSYMTVRQALHRSGVEVRDRHAPRRVRGGVTELLMASSAREELAALRNAEMVDGDPRRWAA